MSPLRSKLDEVRRRMRQLVVLRGSAWLLTVAILGVLASCCADAWWHIDVPAVRVALLTIVVLGVLVGGVLLLVRPWLRTIPDAELARQIERTQARAGSSLISGVEFDSADCGADRGATRLQQAVVAEQTGRLAAVLVDEIVDTRPVQRAVVCALAVCVLAAGALLADRPRASLALHRLLVPLTAPPWPREHTLRLLDAGFQPLSNTQPIVVAAGRTPTFYVEDVQGRLPDRIVLQQWAEEEGFEQQELLPRDVDGDASGARPRRLAAFTLPPHEGECRLRAIGGDDERMPWHSVHRIAAPAIARLELSVRPPAYTKQPVRVMTGPAGPLEALIGTEVEIALTPNKPLQELVLRRDGHPDRPLEPRAAEDGRYVCAWEIEAAGRTPFWFELTDRFGLENFPVTRYELLATEDREPTVSIEHPPTSMTLTPVALVPFRCVAEDDVGLSQVRLLFSDPPGSEGTRLYPLPAVDDGAVRGDLETILSIEEIGAPAGSRIVLRAEATDHYDLGPEHVGRSEPHTVLIVTAEEKLRELLNREIGIAEAIERASAMQADSARETRQLRLQWEHAATLRPQDQDLLSRVIHDSARTEIELYDERRGAETHVDAIRDELEWNQIDDEPTLARLELVSTELQRLRAETLPVLQRSLAAARKASAAPGDDQSAQVADALATAELMQVDAVETLQLLLGMLRGWRERYDLLRSLAEITGEQEQLTGETAAFGQPLLEREARDEQDEADFARLADRQQDLAERVADLAESALQTADEELDPSADRDGLLRLAEAMENSGAAAAMERAAELLRNHNVGEAMTTQADLLESLRSLSESLDQMAPTDAETLLKQVARAEEEVEGLYQRQSEARDRAAALSSAEETPDEELQRLRREQQELAERTGESALRLRKQNIAGAAASSSAAADSMRAAADALQDEISDTALRQQQQALDQLQQAREELARIRQDLELRFALQQASELAATLEAYRNRQRELHDQAGDLVDALNQAGTLRRSQLSALNSLKRTQSELADDTTVLTADMDAMPAFRIVLSAAVDAMHAAAQRLTPSSLSDAPSHQAIAAERLTDVIDALSNGDAGMAPVSPGGPQGDARPGQLDWTLIAQIRLLKGMQLQIARRIAELTQAASADTPLTSAQRLELDELTALQGRAAEAAADLLSAATGGAADAAVPAPEEEIP